MSQDPSLCRGALWRSIAWNRGVRETEARRIEADPMKIHFTLSIDSELLCDAEALAARRGTSVSRLMADQLQELVRWDLTYERARRRAVTRLEEGFDLGWTPPASRDGLHQR